MAALKRLFGDPNTKVLKALQPLVERINALEGRISSLEDTTLRSKTNEFREHLASGGTLDAILPEAYAVVRETAKRTLKQRHFDVQLLGGIILHQGNITEMKTGEGKTLVATLPAYLNALSGKGVHIVTVNDYLSRRDAAWMGQIYAFLGLSVGVLTNGGAYLYDTNHTEKDAERDELGSFKVVHEFLRPSTVQEAYRADITFGTNSEFGFDYLRDNTTIDVSQLRQGRYSVKGDGKPYGGHAFAIIDEIDSILIDEARTPLIISMPSADSENLYATFTAIARQLKVNEDFTIDEKSRSIALTDSGIEKAEKALGISNIYTDRGIKYVHHLETAVRAKALFERDKQYVVQGDEVVIVDEFTGRMQPGRRWSEGLHQAIEAKEGVRVQRESRTAASITYQNYFRLYKKLAGMTGTAATSAEEFYKVYGLETIVVPTNKPLARSDHNDLIFQTEKGKFQAIAREIKSRHDKGQPVLLGTVSVENNERLSVYLKQEGVPHAMLNAKNHEQEGEIIAQAGKKGSVTVATNMAGRGVDIKLGGAMATPDQYEEVKKLGGLFVLGTERHEARRIDNQLRGRSGRQGDPGGTQFFVSLEDSLMRVFASDMIKKMMGRFGIPEDQPIENKIITRSLESAQTKIEGFHFDARKQVLEYDDVLNKQRLAIYERRNRILTGSTEDLEAELALLVGDDAMLSKVVAEKESSLGKDEWCTVVRRLFLQTVDTFWVEHLEMMDYMRSSVNLRAYGQRDPLVEYKKEGLQLFRELQESIDVQIRELIPNVGAGAFRQEEQRIRNLQQQLHTFGGGTGAATRPVNTTQATTRTPGAVNQPEDGKIGRNEPCYCGSGKKYKKCHMTRG